MMVLSVYLYPQTSPAIADGKFLRELFKFKVGKVNAQL